MSYKIISIILSYMSIICLCQAQVYTDTKYVYFLSPESIVQAQTHDEEYIPIRESLVGDLSYLNFLNVARVEYWAARNNGWLDEEQIQRGMTLLTQGCGSLKKFFIQLFIKNDSLSANLTGKRPWPKDQERFFQWARDAIADIVGIDTTQVLFFSRKDTFLWSGKSDTCAGHYNIFSDRRGNLQKLIIIKDDLERNELLPVLAHEGAHFQQDLSAYLRYREPLLRVITEGFQRQREKEIIWELGCRIQEQKDTAPGSEKASFEPILERLSDVYKNLEGYNQATEFIERFLIPLAGSEPVRKAYQTGDINDLHQSLGIQCFNALLKFFRIWEDNKFLSSETAGDSSAELAISIAQEVFLTQDEKDWDIIYSRLSVFADELTRELNPSNDRNITLNQIFHRKNDPRRDFLRCLAIEHARGFVDNQALSAALRQRPDNLYTFLRNLKAKNPASQETFSTGLLAENPAELCV